MANSTSRKRPPDDGRHSPDRKRKAPATEEGNNAPPGKEHFPIRRGPDHPDSKVGTDGHSLPYPLSCMPYANWKALHNREDPNRPRSLICTDPDCRKPKKVTLYFRKLFLVAERLSWVDGEVSRADRELNEELNWEVNYEMGIFGPFVDDSDQMPGGKHSQSHKWYPFEDEKDMEQAFDIVATRDYMTEEKWALSRDIQEPIIAAANYAFRVAAESSQPAKDSEKGDKSGIATPPSSAQEKEKVSVPQLRPPFTRRRTLQDFYMLLDRIERTSLVGARFLEAYAWRLSEDWCLDCYFKAKPHENIFGFDW
jgi:hypothetical protein